jgi:hypothetical protein
MPTRGANRRSIVRPCAIHSTKGVAVAISRAKLGCERAVYGTHNSISEAHLPRYLAEWDFKWNTRKINDGERAALALKGAEGKRLQYRQPRDAVHA